MNLKVLLTVVMLGLSARQAFADAKITGSTRYQFGKDEATVVLSCGGISNPGKENATGTLKLELWALNAPHKEGAIQGHVLAEAKLDGLNPGAGYSNVSRTVNTSLPKVRKAYYLCLVLAEFKNGHYVTTDYRNFSSTATLGPLALFAMSGPWRWQTSIEGGTIDLAVARISHTRTGNTGTLELAAWATSRPYTGGPIEGHLLGVVKKDALQPGYSYTDVHNTAKYKAPPPGAYYVTLVLSEFVDGAYRIQAHLGPNAASVFK